MTRPPDPPRPDPSRPDPPAAEPPFEIPAGAGLTPVRLAYLCEGMALLGEGVAAADIERIAGEAGLPAGPLESLDELSLGPIDDILHGHSHADAHAHEPSHPHRHAAGHDHAHGHADDGPGGHGPRSHDHDHHGHDHHGHDHSPASGHDRAPRAQPMADSAVYVLEKMAHGFRRSGRAAGGGFYDYPPDEPRSLWPGLSTFARGAARLDIDDVRDRLLYAPAVESARQGDGCALVDRIGLAAFVERADSLAARYGERFRVPAALRERAAGAARGG